MNTTARGVALLPLGLVASMLSLGGCFSASPAVGGDETDSGTSADVFGTTTEGPSNGGTTTAGPGTTGSTTSSGSVSSGPTSDASEGAQTEGDESGSSSTTASATTDPGSSSGIGDTEADTTGETEGDTGSTSGGAMERPRTVFLVIEAGGPMGYGGVEGADEFCQATANDAGLSGTYFAWLSGTSASAPAVRFTTDGGPFVRTDGVVVAQDWIDLTDGTIEAALNVLADGSQISDSATVEGNVITHTNADGTRAANYSPCSTYGGDTQNEPYQGDATATDASWSESSDGWACNGDVLGGPSLYCFEQ